MASSTSARNSTAAAIGRFLIIAILAVLLILALPRPGEAVGKGLSWMEWICPGATGNLRPGRTGFVPGSPGSGWFHGPGENRTMAVYSRSESGITLVWLHDRRGDLFAGDRPRLVFGWKISGREAPAIRARCANEVCDDIKPIWPDKTHKCRLRKK